MNFGTGSVSGRAAANQMEWTVNNAFKTYKDMDHPKINDGSGAHSKFYLKFFETAPDGKSRRCKFCGQSYSIATATGNLGRHLSNRHPGYDKSGDSVTSSAPQPITVVKKAQQQGKQQMDYDHLNWLLIKWLILASLPPSTLEEKWLANSFKFLNPSIQLWSGEQYKAVFREVFRSMQEDVKATLEQVSSKVSIILDFWSSYEQIFYMSVTCQWIDENWSFQQVLLDICQIPYPCGGSEIYHSLEKVLKMYSIESKVLSCTHDNSQNAIHACHTLKEELDGQKLGLFCYIPCAARTLNLIIEDGLRTTKAVISKVREFVLELNSSAEMSDYFIQLTEAYQEGSWKFPLETSARWSGNYQMLDIVCKAGKSMDGVMRKYEETIVGKDGAEPCRKECSQDSRHSSDWLKNAAEDMATKSRSYTTQVCNIFIFMTAILDPRIKCELIPESLSSGNYLEEARTIFIRNYSSSHFSSMTSGYGAQEIEDGGGVSFAEEIARKKRRVSLSNVPDELTQYLSEPPAPIPTDVLEWWKVNSTRYPRLSVMARDFLAVQPTSIAPEDLFCSKGDEIDKQRFCMPHDSTQAILCIRSWTQGGIKLKYKSTEIDYERLMELAAATTADNTAGLDKKQK
ncbi:BED FINGER-RELATED [Salix koriyanagi]|uniref:BED FINGER-RELATED n=1 Tax=Salix koriyanagi TaxID=2511006 RepID=A0A9Q0WDQ2_9ROSI|nr:BED FINGER-RELATED [Salix koriyanagi]